MGSDYCHVLRQASNTSFEVVSSTGVQGVCSLSTAITQPGQMLVLAWDNLGGAYAVVHLTDNAVKLEPITGTVFPSGAIVAYSLINSSADAVWLENDAAAPLTIPDLPVVNGIDPRGDAYAYWVDNNGNAVVVYYGSPDQYAWVFKDGSYAVLDQVGFDSITTLTLSQQPVSADGSVFVGSGYHNNGLLAPLVWNQQGVQTVLPTQGLSNNVAALCCSSNGRRIVGFDVDNNAVVTWTNGVLDPAYPPIPGDISGGVQSINITPDGNTILIGAQAAGNHNRILTLRDGIYAEIPSAGPSTLTIYITVANNDLSVIAYSDSAKCWITYNRGVTWQQLPNLGGGYNYITGADDSGSIIVGGVYDSNGMFWAVYWQDGQLIRLAQIPGSELINSYHGIVNAVSRNGVYLFGDSYNAAIEDLTVLWTRKTI
jgi:hypothetical protein